MARGLLRAEERHWTSRLDSQGRVEKMLGRTECKLVKPQRNFVSEG